ncbi:YraN family protein [Candidatus Roizmanbacteria bacterium]|nr:YraN family protein [Candidatus Roizmanbacteria bacterium]
MNSKKDIGRLGEAKAVDFLLNKGYRIIQKNFHSHWGEIDIIAKKDSKVAFIEVKTRIGLLKGKPYESVDKRKLQKLMRPIQFYLLQNHLKDYKLSLDVISIVLNYDLRLDKIIHFENVLQDISKK